MPTKQQLISGFPFTMSTGSHDLGPANLPDNLSNITLSLARCTTATPLNWPNESTTIAVTLYISPDGGTTWTNVGGFTAAGGILLRSLDNSELAATAFYIQTPLTTGGTGRKIKATVVVTGGPLSSIASIDADIAQ